MTAKNDQSTSTEVKTKARQGSKKSAGAVSANKMPAKPKSEPKPKATKTAKTPRSAKLGKGDQLVEMMQRKGGATMAEMQKTSGWQAHSVRGFLSGIVRKKMGLTVISVKQQDGGRVYTLDA